MSAYDLCSRTGVRTRNGFQTIAFEFPPQFRLAALVGVGASALAERIADVQDLVRDGNSGLLALLPSVVERLGVLCEGTLHRPHSYAPCTLDDVPSDGHAAAEEDAEGVVHLARLVSLGDESNIVPELVGGGEPAAVTEEGDACGGCLQADGRD